MERPFALAAGALAGIAIAGCSGGYAESDAIDRCAIEEANNGACFNDAAREACVGCFEECGEQCNAAKTCPLTYECP